MVLFIKYLLIGLSKALFAVIILTYKFWFVLILKDSWNDLKKTYF